jgi:transglutaminase-like putative cysteine protease
MTGSTRVVSADLGFVVAKPIELVLQVAAATTTGTVTNETFDVRIDGESIDQVDELRGPNGARLHCLDSPTGHLTVHYRAEIDTAVPPDRVVRVADTVPVREYAEILYLRPSRYCPTDHLVGFARAEFTSDDVAARVSSVMEWIWERIEYLPGSGSVHDSAEDTLLTGTGTCRDFAHLGVALCRALGVPARFTAVYAPGLSPMDFHAVVEIHHEGHWLVEDPTRLAPRSSMVRIATGRDAADTAFATIEGGMATLTEMEVTATVGTALPSEHPGEDVHLR